MGENNIFMDEKRFRGILFDTPEPFLSANFKWFTGVILLTPPQSQT